MKPIELVYENDSEGSWYSYEPLLESMGYEMIFIESDSNYQGDSYVLFKKKNQLGYLRFGWGSCSGCDSLQACGNYQQLESLRKELDGQIQWMNKKEMVKWLREKDWSLEFVNDHHTLNKFLDRVENYLQTFVGLGDIVHIKQEAYDKDYVREQADFKATENFGTVVWEGFTSEGFFVIAGIHPEAVAKDLNDFLSLKNKGFKAEYFGSIYLDYIGEY